MAFIDFGTGPGTGDKLPDALKKLQDRLDAGIPGPQGPKGDVGPKGDKGDIGNSSLAVGLKTQMTSTVIPAGVDFVETTGYSVLGIGSGLYVFDASITDAMLTNTPEIYFKTSNNRRFRLIQSPWTAEHFGAMGDGVTDDTQAISRLIVSAPPASRVCLSRGKYVISSTLPGNSDVVFDMAGATIIAKAGAQFEYMLRAVGCSNFNVQNGTFDANRQNRMNGQTIRMMGVGFANSVDCRGFALTCRNTVGYNGTPAVCFTASDDTIRCGYDNCLAIDGGVSGAAADGFFVSGRMPYVRNSLAENCLDTGFVLESCDFGLVSGCTSNNCSAGGAVTNASNVDRRGNRILGLTINNWSSVNTGGVQIGIPDNHTGNLLDTVVDVLMSVTDSSKGQGPAIAVRSQGQGRAKGVTISGRIVGAGTQGILVDGDNVLIRAEIAGTSASAIQYQTGSTGRVENTRVFGGGSFGIITTGTAKIDVVDSAVFGVATWGGVAFDTSTIRFSNTALEANGSGTTTKDPGATILNTSIRTGNVTVNDVQVVTNRQTGWNAVKGASDKATSYTTYTAPTYSAAPTSSDLQDVANQLQALSRRYAALEGSNRVHGLID